jgi:tRNA(Ile2) C34 agmatinyltransferase TiaS
MKIGINLIIAVLFALLSHAQTRTVTSATCGSCKKAVSASSQVGDRCPHCGVRWGYEM